MFNKQKYKTDLQTYDTHIRNISQVIFISNLWLPFFSGKQCSWAEWLKQHRAHNSRSNAHTHFHRKERTKENKSSVAFTSF